MNALEDFLRYKKSGYSKSEIPSSEHIEEVISALNSNNWIPVSERLPEPLKAVLAYTPKYRNTYTAYLDEGEWRHFGGWGYPLDCNVTHWMKLPENPND